MLSDLYLETSYHRGQDDIAQSFYLPCMRQATKYDRAVGYFSSSVFIVAWPALKDFIGRGGKIRILCSQVLSEADVNALDVGYLARLDYFLEKTLLDEIQKLLRDDKLKSPTRILSALIAKGSIEFQIAIIDKNHLNSSTNKIFHDKLGIFSDDDDGVVIFKGSMNETWNGLSSDGNLESVDVAANWMGERDLQRTSREQEFFSRIWSNNYPDLLVRPFPEVAKEELRQAADPDWESSLSSLLQKSQPRDLPMAHVDKIELRPHQTKGLASWRENARCGILAFATGSGKTLTALHAIKEAITLHSNVVILVVPDHILFEQWDHEIANFLSDLNIKVLKAGDGHTKWKTLLKIWTEPGKIPRLILSTMQTASTEEFIRNISRGKHVFLVADEVHRLGSSKNQALMNESFFGPRLGLSATPERAGDDEGTTAILSFFKGIMHPRYTLTDAINDGVLCRYFYHPHIVRLSEDEYQEWQLVTKKIMLFLASKKNDSTVMSKSKRLKLLLIKRAKIIKNAKAKVHLAENVIRSLFKQGQKWIIYCDNQIQLQKVCDLLNINGTKSFPYHSKMKGDRKETLHWFEAQGGILVAIKCLDEGVDIPSVTHALILASSKNPREFIQRRGRVLRTSPGKNLAYIHDAIVIPPSDLNLEKDFKTPDAIIASELARALEFGQHADNPGGITTLQEIAIEMGIDWQTFSHYGVEDVDDES